MERYPLVTVIVPCYRNFEHMYETLDSVLEQDYPNYELIIGDDASENFPKEGIERYIEAHKTNNLKRVIVYANETNLGTVKNCNTIIKKSQGQYIIGISLDDIYESKDVISSVVEKFQSSDALVVTGKRRLIDENGVDIGKILPIERDQNKFMSMTPEQLYRELLKGNCIGTGAYYDRRCFDQYDLFDERFILIEDWPTYLILSKAGEKIDFLDKVTFRYRDGGMSRSKTPPQALVQDFLNIYRYLINPNIIEDTKKCLKERIDTQKKLVIYGTGNEGSKILVALYCLDEKIKPSCYVVSDGFLILNKKDDIPVYQLSDLPFEKQEIQILVSDAQTDVEHIISRLKEQSLIATVIDQGTLNGAWTIYHSCNLGQKEHLS